MRFNQETWLKPYIDISTKLRTEAKSDFEKDFFKLMNNAVFRKTIENVRKHRYLKLATRDKKEINQFQNLFIIQKILFRKFDGNRNEKKGKNE